MNNSIAIIVFVVFLQLSVFAEEAPTLSGIMQGDSPSAIINNKFVTVGETVDGYRIVDIGADYVQCQGQRGIVRLSMAQEDSTKEQSKTKKSQNAAPVKAPAATAAQGTTREMQAKARKYLDRSVEYLKEADKLLRSPFMFEWLYAKAIDLCEAADREAQLALRLVTEDALKMGIIEHIGKIRKAKELIVQEKANFNTRIRSMISARQIVTGMTQRDVVSSWGQPLMQNRDGTLEKWVYQDANGYQKELVFKDGIMVSF